jgi:hypothetical protein
VFATLPGELPVSTIIVLRSIADIARHEGKFLSDPGMHSLSNWADGLVQRMHLKVDILRSVACTPSAQMKLRASSPSTER